MLTKGSPRMAARMRGNLPRPAMVSRRPQGPSTWLRLLSGLRRLQMRPEFHSANHDPLFSPFCRNRTVARWRLYIPFGLLPAWKLRRLVGNLFVRNATKQIRDAVEAGALLVIGG